MTAAPPPVGWIPLLVGEDQGIQVDWVYMGEARFTEAFFWDTAKDLAARPFNQLFRPRTGIETLVARAETLPGLPLAGLVFHLSRCGSTLACRALAALPDSVVLSEPGPLDSLLRLLHAAPRPEGVAWLRALVAALGQPRRPGDRRLFIKLDSWHMGWFELLRAAFPDTPWIFVYRDPLEVMVSHRREVGLTVLPGHVPDALLGPAPEGLPEYTPMGQAVRVLGMIMAQAARAMADHDGGRLVNYSELPEAFLTSLAEHFRLGLGEADSEAMRGACGWHSKRPGQAFAGDTEAKRREADATVRDISDRWLLPSYRRLEALRVA